MKVKKIAALAVGAAMIGATIGFASAQPTVPNIPKDFFVKNGQPNVKIVVGSAGAAQDVASAADIAVAIGSILYTQKDVKEVTVTVKKEKTEPVVGVNPADIPVFYNEWKFANSTTNGVQGKPYAWSQKEEAKNVAGWWNGAEYTGICSYCYNEHEFEYYNWWEINESAFTKFNESVWSDYTLTLDEIHFKYGKDKNPMDFAIWKEGYIKLENPIRLPEYKVSFDKGNVIDYYISIGSIRLKGLQENSTTPDSVFGGVTLYIPKNQVHVKMDFKLYLNRYYPPSICHTKPDYYIADYEYNTVKTVRLGLTEGDTFTLFNKNVTIVGLEGSVPGYEGYALILGTPYKPQFINTGSAVKFGNYTVKVLDVDINSNKALLEVSGPEGNEVVSLYEKDYAQKNDLQYSTVLFNGGIYIEVDSVFVGVDGTTAAQVKVATNLVGINKGDEIIPGWIVDNLTIVENTTKNKTVYYLQSLDITNKNSLQGKSIDLFGLYKLNFVEQSKTYTCASGETCYTAEAYIDFDPITITKEYTENVTGTANIKTIVPGKVTAPITVLDTEIMEQGLDKVDSNLILVGGPVVNKVTAALADKLGIPANYTGWKEKYGTGKESGIIKYVAKCGAINGYGVVLVAGTDREGTKAAAEALMEYISKL